jgi:hypothetical protein
MGKCDPPVHRQDGGLMMLRVHNALIAINRLLRQTHAIAHGSIMKRNDRPKGSLRQEQYRMSRI